MLLVLWRSTGIQYCVVAKTTITRPSRRNRQCAFPLYHAVPAAKPYCPRLENMQNERQYRLLIFLCRRKERADPHFKMLKWYPTSFVDPRFQHAPWHTMFLTFSQSNSRLPTSTIIFFHAAFLTCPWLCRATQHDAWGTLRGDLDKVQMGVATPDQLRGTYAAANAPTGPPPPPAPRGLAPSPSPPPPPPPPPPQRCAPSNRDQANRGSEDRSGREEGKERNGARGERVDRRARGEEAGGTTKERGKGRRRDGSSSPPPPPPPPRSRHSHHPEPHEPIIPLSETGLGVVSMAKTGQQIHVGAGDTGGDWGDRARGVGRSNRSRSPSPRGSGRRRSPTNGRSRDSSRNRDRERDRMREKDRKRKRDRERGRERDRSRSRERERERRGERAGRADPRRGDSGGGYHR